MPLVPGSQRASPAWPRAVAGPSNRPMGLNRTEVPMTAKLTFHPLGNADCTRIDLADGRKILLDYADMRNADDQWDNRINLPAELKADLRAAKRDYYDTVCFTHLDNDHCCGAHDFFWWDHAKKYQGE